MCVSQGNPILTDPLSKKVFGGDSDMAKLNAKVNPGHAYLTTGQRDKLDPGNLKNAPDEIKPPPPLQELKEPDSMYKRREARLRYNKAGTILTGPNGIGAGSLNTGGNTLLGG